MPYVKRRINRPHGFVMTLNDFWRVLLESAAIHSRLATPGRGAKGRPIP